MQPDARAPGALPLTAFTMAVLIGGGNFIAVRFSNRVLDPFWGAGLRFSLTALAFVVLALVLRLQWPRGRQLFLTAVYGVLAFAAFYALMYWALVRVTAGVATVVMAIVPLVTVLLAVAQGYERLQVRSAVGALLAVVGIAWMVVGPQRVDIPPAALGALLLAAVAVGQSVIVSKRVAGNHPAITNAVAISIGAVLLLALSAVNGEQWVLPREAEAVWALAYLVTAGSMALFVLVLLVVRVWTASATSYLFVLFPVATMALGALVAGEPVTLQAVVGAVLVMLGVWYGALAPARRREPEREPATAAPAPEAPAVAAAVPVTPPPCG